MSLAMKNILICFTIGVLLFCGSAVAQQYNFDTLEYAEGHYYFVLSPKDEILGTNDSCIFYSKDINSPVEEYKNFKTDFPNAFISYDPVIWFAGNDTALITGAFFLYSQGNSPDTIDYLISTNGGKDWTICPLDTVTLSDEDGNIDNNEAYYYYLNYDKIQDGYIWLYNRKGMVFYSNNCAKTFTKIQLPFSAEKDYSIKMKDSLNGVICNNFKKQIYLTKDNWQSYETVYQGDTLNKRYYSFSDNIGCFLWKNYIIYNTDGVWYYRSFEDTTVHILSENDDYVSIYNDTLYLINRHKIKMYSDNLTNYKYIKKINRNETKIYVYNIVKYIDGERFERPIYLNKRIKQLNRNYIVKGKNLQWSYYNYGYRGEIFVSEIDNDNWQRVADFDGLYPRRLQLLSDSVAIIGTKYDNYLFFLKNKRLVKYQYEDNLKSFFNSKINKVTVSEHIGGCVGPHDRIAEYYADKDSLYCDSLLLSFIPSSSWNKKELYHNSISIKQLTNILKDINKNHNKENLSIKDFHISKEDKANYTEKLNKIFTQQGNIIYWGGHNYKRADSSLYYDFINKYDTISKQTLQTFISAKYVYSAEAYSFFSPQDYLMMEIENDEGQVITLYNSCLNDKFFYTPIFVNYNKDWFVSYNKEAGKLMVDSYKSNNDLSKGNKVQFLLDLADFLINEYYIKEPVKRF